MKLELCCLIYVQYIGHEDAKHHKKVFNIMGAKTQQGIRIEMLYRRNPGHWWLWVRIEFPPMVQNTLNLKGSWLWFTEYWIIFGTQNQCYCYKYPLNHISWSSLTPDPTIRCLTMFVTGVWKPGFTVHSPAPQGVTHEWTGIVTPIGYVIKSTQLGMCICSQIVNFFKFTF